MARSEQPRTTGPFRLLSDALRDYLDAGLDQAPLPDGRFSDPDALSEEFTETHVLPRKPDPDRQPEAHRAWRAALVGIEHWIKPTSGTARILRLARAANPAPGETSSNWSGAVARTLDHSSLTTAHGAWSVPHTSLRKGANSFSMCSMWIGFDGHDPDSNSLPQIGSANVYLPLSQSNMPELNIVLWWEWFRRNADTNGYLALPIQAKPGDRLSAIITRIAPSTVRFFIRNFDTATATPFQFDLSKWTSDWTLTPVEARTAEWILERPRAPGPKRAPLLGLPDFADTGFNACIATAASATAPQVDLAKAKLIRLIDWRTAPPGSRALATAYGKKTTSFRIRNGL